MNQSAAFESGMRTGFRIPVQVCTSRFLVHARMQLIQFYKVVSCSIQLCLMLRQNWKSRCFAVGNRKCQWIDIFCFSSIHTYVFTCLVRNSLSDFALYLMFFRFVVYLIWTRENSQKAFEWQYHYSKDGLPINSLCKCFIVFADPKPSSVFYNEVLKVFRWKCFIIIDEKKIYRCVCVCIVYIYVLYMCMRAVFYDGKCPFNHRIYHTKGSPQTKFFFYWKPNFAYLQKSKTICDQLWKFG